MGVVTRPVRAAQHLHQTDVFEFLLRNETRGSNRDDADFSNTFDTVCLFADISGFTALSEVMSQQFGVGGAAGLKKHLNQYFGLMVRIVMKHGGDVIKFAGDAMIVLWPPAAESLVTQARRAVQCSLEIQTKLHKMKLYVATPHDINTMNRADGGGGETDGPNKMDQDGGHTNTSAALTRKNGRNRDPSSADRVVATGVVPGVDGDAEDEPCTMYT